MKLPGDALGQKVVMFLCLIGGNSAMLAQRPANLPATAPTTSVSQLPSANPPVRRGISHLVVLWNGVALQVEATNVSLNAVLHEIGAKTTMKITGSAPDERIFGSYGPGPLNLVVPALLNGVAVNMLLTEREGGAKNELVLTDRQGGATPAYVPTQQDADAGTNVQQSVQGRPQNGLHRGFGVAGRRGPGQPVPPNGIDPVIPDNGINGRDNGLNGPNNGINGQDDGVNGRDNGQNGVDNGLNNTATPGTVNAEGAINQPTSDGSSPSNGSTTGSPDGVKTPQEIFEQLQKLRQQQTTTTPQ